MLQGGTQVTLSLLHNQQADQISICSSAGKRGSWQHRSHLWRPAPTNDRPGGVGEDAHGIQDGDSDEDDDKKIETHKVGGNDNDNWI